MSMNTGPEMTQYTIQPGDTLWELANDFGTTVEDIMAANPGIDPDNLQVGQVIMLADPDLSAQQRPPARGPERRPSERRPEEFRRRPEEFRRRPGEFRRRPEFRRPFRRPFYRPYRPYYPYAPYPPYAGACPAGMQPYVIEPGDNLYNIAARFGVSVDAVIAANPYINFGLALPIGQLICIPF